MPGGVATSALGPRRRPIQRLASLANGDAARAPVAVGSSVVRLPSPPPWPPSTRRPFASRSRGKRKKKEDANAPLLNEHLIAALFNRKGRGGTATADTFEVRLIVDRGRAPTAGGAGVEAGEATAAAGTAEEDDEGGDADAEEEAGEDAADDASQVTTLARAIALTHELELDLMEVTLRADPPVLRAADADGWLYAQRRRERRAAAQKRREGGGAVSDRATKEFKFRAGIADHDLERKAGRMMGYLDKGHAVQVTLTARGYMLRQDEGAIATTLDRVRELVGDRAVEARGMRANARKNYGSLLLHPNPNKRSKA